MNKIEKRSIYNQKQSEGDDSSNKEDFGGATSIKDIPASSSARVAETTLKPVDDAARSSQGTSHPEGAAAVPLGLGLGGLHPKVGSSLAIFNHY